MAARESEGLIPVDADTTQNQAVSPLTPAQQHHTGGPDTLDTISPDPTGPAPSYEKSQQLHDSQSPAEPPAVQPAEPTKSYPGEPRAEPDAAAYPVNSPSDVKAYPGQPTPQQGQQHPQQYYTPFGQPSGYASCTPLHALQSAPAPVDCPCCGRREMTRTEAVSGGTTQ
ncbi:hypothetical protein N7512_008258 [Penicillium capsulatum]|nr:hypothetical protein N7512_008258 [Penicillium capsulatum]